VATTDAYGHFQLTGVPATTHVPLVVQTGKWRREVFLNSVTACQDNPVAAQNTRLPRNRKEGDMPQMLLMNGGCDDLGCFLRSIGVDASEFTAPKGGGRVDVFAGSGGATLSNGTAGTWGTPVFAKSDYEYYDIALLACECAPHMEPTGGPQALHDWLNEGGKVFASHFNYTWFQNGPTDFQGVATWKGSSIAIGMGNYNLDTTFPKGMVLREWLDNIKAIPANSNTIALKFVADSVGTVNMTKPQATVRWIYDGTGQGGGLLGGGGMGGMMSTAGDVKYLSFLTPIGGIPGSTTGENGGPGYCGKAVFTDLHTTSSINKQYNNIPADCPNNTALNAQQDALEFLFFDLSACVSPDNQPPPPPPQSVQ
ncbi:MAG TPA: hypothetical protein VKU41_24045, partial [Polyangiaceae bacterium]|nr:hypothetical protein [Polyangiaceae bacterium]